MWIIWGPGEGKFEIFSSGNAAFLRLKRHKTFFKPLMNPFHGMFPEHDHKTSFYNMCFKLYLFISESFLQVVKVETRKFGKVENKWQARRQLLIDSRFIVPEFADTGWWSDVGKCFYCWSLLREMLVSYYSGFLFVSRPGTRRTLVTITSRAHVVIRLIQHIAKWDMTFTLQYFLLLVVGWK